MGCETFYHPIRLTVSGALVPSSPNLFSVRIFMRFFFYILFFTVAFPTGVNAAADNTLIRNEKLGFSFSVPGDWPSHREEVFVFDGEEFSAAYWGQGKLGDSMPFILVRSVETGKVKHEDMTGLNKIAIQSTMNGLAHELKPVLAVQNFYPCKALFSYSIEKGTDPDHRVLANKYVYYTEKGMLEFTMYCGFKDTETMVTTNIALKNVDLDQGVAYRLRELGRDSFWAGLDRTTTMLAGIAAALVVTGGILYFRRRS